MNCSLKRVYESLLTPVRFTITIYTGFKKVPKQLDELGCTIISIFLYLSSYICLNPRRGHQKGPGEPSAGVCCFFLFVFLVFVQC